MCIRYSMPLYINHPYLSLRYRLPPCSDICGSLQLGFGIDYSSTRIATALYLLIYQHSQHLCTFVFICLCVLFIRYFVPYAIHIHHSIHYYNIALHIHYIECVSYYDINQSTILCHYSQLLNRYQLKMIAKLKRLQLNQ